MVNTEQADKVYFENLDYNILNIVVNTELGELNIKTIKYYNILNIVVNTELIVSSIL